MDAEAGEGEVEGDSGAQVSHTPEDVCGKGMLKGWKWEGIGGERRLP